MKEHIKYILAETKPYRLETSEKLLMNYELDLLEALLDRQVFFEHYEDCALIKKVIDKKKND